jgi:membrane fusion protein, multidrug efflux system
MEQRTDTEHRLDDAPGHDVKPAIGEARKTQSWLDRMRRRRRQVLVVTALIVAGIVGTVTYWLNTSSYESTDDAFIDARTVSISAQVGAAIVDVAVTDNQLVEAGTALVRLDDRDFRAQVDQATAQVYQAKANMANIDAQVAAQRARIDQADKQTAQSQATLTFAQQQEKRYTTLVKTGAGSVEQAQQYASNLLQAHNRPTCCWDPACRWHRRSGSNERTAPGVAIAEKRTGAPQSWNIVVQSPPASPPDASKSLAHRPGGPPKGPRGH